jgi:hypothetical protein
MLFRTGRQLQFLLGVTELPPVLLCPPQNNGLAECMAYAAYNTPAFAEAQYNFYKDVVAVLGARERQFHALPGHKVLGEPAKDALDIIENRNNPPYRDREIQIRALLDYFSTAPFIFRKYQCNGHANYVPISHGEFELTTIIAESKHGHSLIGRCTSTTWYSYDAQSGIALVPEADVRRRINRLANPEKIGKKDDTDRKKIERLYYIYIMYHNKSHQYRPINYVPIADNLLQMYEATQDQIIYIKNHAKTNPRRSSKCLTRPIVNPANTCYINAPMQLIARMPGLEDIEQQDSIIPSFLLEMLMFPFETAINPADEFIMCYGAKENTSMDESRKYIQDDPAAFLTAIYSLYAEVGKFFDENAVFETYSGVEAVYECEFCKDIPDAREIGLITSRAETTKDLLLRVPVTFFEGNLNSNLSSVLKKFQKTQRDKEDIRSLQCSLYENHYRSVDVKGSTNGHFGRYVIIQIIQPFEEKTMFGLSSQSEFTLQGASGTIHRYSISAVIMHRGTTTRGHYVTMAPNKDNKIVVYDDSIGIGLSQQKEEEEEEEDIRQLGPFDTYSIACNTLLDASLLNDSIVDRDLYRMIASHTMQKTVKDNRRQLYVVSCH